MHPVTYALQPTRDDTRWWEQGIAVPSILLLDLKMPRMDGFRVMEWLSAHQKIKDILVIVLSGQDRGDLENVRHAYRLGARSFLVKPCHVQDIHNLIRAYSTFWETAWAASENAR